jgi:3-hydroxy acid dehydrogenase/malonic semialdehyde reductase
MMQFLRYSKSLIAPVVLIGATSTALLAGNTAFCSPQQSTSEATKKLNRKTTPTDLTDKVVLITGATAGIGKACAESFADHGSKLILVGRRAALLEELKTTLIKTHPNLRVHVVALSVADSKAVEALPASLPVEFRNVSVLVNNAGLALGVTSVDANIVADAEQVLQTNVMGVIAMCRAFLPGMIERGEGHLINMGSVAGHYSYATGSVYCASKYAVRGFTEAARHDLAGTPIRVTHISPGLVGNTEFSNVRLKDDEKAKLVYANLEALVPEDCADATIYAATRPAHCQIADVILYCTNQSGPRDVVRLGQSMGKK